MKHPLPILTAAFIAGIGLGIILKLPQEILLFSAGALLIITLSVKGSRLFIFSSSLLFVIIGLLLITPKLYPKDTPNQTSLYDIPEYKNVTGTIKSSPEIFPDKTQIIISDIMTKENGEWTPIRGKLRLTVYENIRDLRIGDKVFFYGKLRKPRNFNNPGGFDYDFYLKRRGIFLTSALKDDKSLIVSRENVLNPSALIERARSEIRGFFDEKFSNPEGAIIKALILGERGDIPEDLLSAYYETGVGHVLAISGLHVGIVFIFSFFIAYLILVRIPGFALRFSVRKWASILSLIPVLAYTLISGVRITAVRSALMVFAFALSVLAGKERDVLNTLSLAALIILVVSPASLFETSFQFSFIAVTAIIFIFPVVVDPVRQRVYRIEGVRPSFIKRALFRIYQFSAVSISAMIGILPLSAYYFFRATPVTLSLNFVVIPILGFFATPLSLFATPTIFLFPDFAQIVFDIASWGVSIANEVVIFADNLFSSGFIVIPPTLIEMAIYYLILIFVVLNFKRKRWRKKLIIPALSILIALLCLDIVVSINKRYNPKELSATFISVGQGDSTFMKFPGGETMLVDGGGFYSGNFDVGEMVVSPYLFTERVRRIDYLVLTHPQIDHYGGLFYILENFDVGEFWIGSGTKDSESISHLIDISKERDIPIIEVDADTPPMMIGGVDLFFFNPPGDGIERKYQNENDGSVVFRLVYGGFSLLMTGDIEDDGESFCLSSEREIRSTVIKAAHHGGTSRNSMRFIRAVMPEAVVISCGYQNPFGFPTKEAIDEYRSIGTIILRTDIDGAVEVSSDGESFKIRSETKRRYQWKLP